MRTVLATLHDTHPDFFGRMLGPRVYPVMERALHTQGTGDWTPGGKFQTDDEGTLGRALSEVCIV